jgi:hypothetical protein
MTAALPTFRTDASRSGTHYSPSGRQWDDEGDNDWIPSFDFNGCIGKTAHKDDTAAPPGSNDTTEQNTSNGPEREIGETSPRKDDVREHVGDLTHNDNARNAKAPDGAPSTDNAAPSSTESSTTSSQERVPTSASTPLIRETSSNNEVVASKIQEQLRNDVSGNTQTSRQGPDTSPKGNLLYNSKYSRLVPPAPTASPAPAVSSAPTLCPNALAFEPSPLLQNEVDQKLRTYKLRKEWCEEYYSKEAEKAKKRLEQQQEGYLKWCEEQMGLCGNTRQPASTGPRSTPGVPAESASIPGMPGAPTGPASMHGGLGQSRYAGDDGYSRPPQRSQNYRDRRAHPQSQRLQNSRPQHPCPQNHRPRDNGYQNQPQPRPQGNGAFNSSRHAQRVAATATDGRERRSSQRQ